MTRQVKQFVDSCLCLIESLIHLLIMMTFVTHSLCKIETTVISVVSSVNGDDSADCWENSATDNALGSWYEFSYDLSILWSFTS